PGEKYNPLYIHGPSGAGKSVLLAALGNEIAKRYPELPIAYLDGPGFAAELIQALERNRVENWRERFRRARVLILDDLHVLAGAGAGGAVPSLRLAAARRGAARLCRSREAPGPRRTSGPAAYATRGGAGGGAPGREGPGSRPGAPEDQRAGAHAAGHGRRGEP